MGIGGTTAEWKVTMDADSRRPAGDEPTGRDERDRRTQNSVDRPTRQPPADTSEGDRELALVTLRQVAERLTQLGKALRAGDVDALDAMMAGGGAATVFDLAARTINSRRTSRVLVGVLGMPGAFEEGGDHGGR